jgi:protein gp37
MSQTTGIEWTDATWSPVRVRVKPDAAAIAEAKGYTSLVQIAAKMAGRVGPHCEHVSPGCLNCYAETNNHRCLPGNGTGLPYERRSRDLVDAFVDERILLQPLGWKKPLKIFVENQSDLFGEWVTDGMLARVFAVMALCPQHTFQVLTKRPERMLAYLSDDMQQMNAMCAEDVLFGQLTDGAGTMGHSWPLPNVWLGVSVERQQEADERIPLLLQTPAAVRFISAEPLLGFLDLTQDGISNGDCIHCSDGSQVESDTNANGCSRCDGTGKSDEIALDWVICGGESGPGARPMHPEWARSLRDQCATAGVPFFFKQWGEWIGFTGEWRAVEDGSRTFAFPDGWNFSDRAEARTWSDGVAVRVGKKAAGALLDGVEHHAFPEVRA